MMSLQQEIAFLNEEPSAAQIVTISGRDAGLATLLASLLGSEDHVIAFSPCHQSLAKILYGSRSEVTWLALSNDWQPDLEKLSQAIRPNSKALIINFPHNPTGATISKEKLLEIVVFAAQHELYLVSDESSRHLEYDPLERLPCACDLYEKAVSVCAIDWTRMTWIATQDTSLLRQIAKMSPHMPHSSFTAYSKDIIVAERLGQILHNLDLLRAFIKRHDHFSWHEPQAGSVCMIKLLPELPIESLVEKLLAHSAVLLLPGTLYGITGNYFRLDFGRKDFQLGLEHIESVITQALLATDKDSPCNQELENLQSLA